MKPEHYKQIHQDIAKAAQRKKIAEQQRKIREILKMESKQS